MMYLVLSIICSVTVSVLLKCVPRFAWDVRQMVMGGYAVAAGLCVLTLDAHYPASWTHFMQHAGWLWLVLGLLLPSLFLVLARSVDTVGIVLSDAAQRLSLILPLIAAFTWFGEAFTGLKLLGISCGLLALGLMLVHTRDGTQRGLMQAWLWPLLVFLGFGLVDILFKQMALLAAIPFADVLLAIFSLAFVLGSLYIATLLALGRTRFAWRHVIGMLLLGGFNFGNILFYIRAHQQLASDPALVFSAMNIGVIALGALVGLYVFKEPLNRLNKLGIICAIVAIGMLASTIQA